MMVTRELSTFGEELKLKWLPGPRTMFTTHARYDEAKGNLQKMKKLDLEGLLVKAFWLFLAPLGSIYAAFQSGYEGLGFTLFGLYSAVVVLWFGLKLLRFIIKVGYFIAGKPHPLAKPLCSGIRCTKFGNSWRDRLLILP